MAQYGARGVHERVTAWVTVISVRRTKSDLAVSLRSERCVTACVHTVHITYRCKPQTVDAPVRSDGPVRAQANEVH